MATETHTFDPDGDLLLILLRPSADESGTFAVSAGNKSGIDEDGAPEGGKPDIVVQMLVSAKHMMLASPVFKAMLQHSTFKEGRKLSSAGKVEVSLPDDDPTTFKIILDIIHGRNKQVPRQVDFDSLNSISILVDKYQMAEAVESFSECWIDALRGALPTEYTTDKEVRDVHRWLGISWVFEKDEEFRKMTALTEHGCYASLAENIEDGLPIPDLIVSTIFQKREDALSELYGLIEETISRYRRPEILCPLADILCDSLLLGSIQKGATILEILPVPKAPFGDISFDEMTAKLYSLNVSSSCDNMYRSGSPPFGRFGSHRPAHELKETIRKSIKVLEKRLSGLDILDFKAKQKNPRPVMGV